MDNKIELLAPAGSLERLKTAVLYGADAVYVGGEEFSLREAAENFTAEQMAQGIAFAHSRHVRVYAAMNIIAHNRDLDNIVQYAKQLYEMDINAVIVADMGVFFLLREKLPKLNIHISTQANTLNYASATALFKLGAKRVVLARELGLEEITEIRDKTPMGLELEVFVHGAMCISYSGRCLLSNYMIDRDSNRGACAQPCRWKYHLVEDTRPDEYLPVFENDRGTFIFNSKDLCLIEHIDKLIQSGVSSFKIEGRVKTEYYVATIVKAWREAIDDYYLQGSRYAFDPQQLEEVKKVSHRGYTTGFFEKPADSTAQNYATSSYIRDYDLVGVVTAYDERTGIATVRQRNRFFRGDTLEIIQPGVRGFSTMVVFYLKDAANMDIEAAPHSNMELKMDLGCEIKVNSFLRKAKEQG